MPKWWNKPITWGDSVKASLVGVALTGVVYGGLAIMVKVATRNLVEAHEALKDQCTEVGFEEEES